jgi:hypothetical protein
MKALFYPAGNKQRASSRYRVWWVVAERKEWHVGSLTGTEWRNAQVLVFQRQQNGPAIKLAKEAKRHKKLIVYDCTDFYFHEKWGAQQSVDGMARIAHILTTGNKDDAWSMRHRYKRKRVYVVPNAQRASAYPEKKKHRMVTRPRVIWFGRVGNLGTLRSIWPHFENLARAGIPFEVLLVTDTGTTGNLKLDRRHPVRGKKWTLGGINKLIVSADVAVCPQIRQPDGRFHKDENRAVTAWMCGLPCVTFNITKNWHNDLRRFLVDWKLRARSGQKNIERAKKWEARNVAKTWERVFQEGLRRL